MITIEQIEMIRGRVRLIMDNGEKITLTRSGFHTLNLQINEPIEESDFNKKILLIQYRPALNKAVSMLALRACSQGEIRQKLLHDLYSKETVNMVIYKLQKEKLLDDIDFAVQWIISRQRQKYGNNRIRRELINKEVSLADIDSAFSLIEDENSQSNQISSALALARKSFSRSKSGEDPRKIRQRIIAMLIRKGYDFDTSKKAVLMVLDNTESEYGE